jgi:hypothetical protein
MRPRPTRLTVTRGDAKAWPWLVARKGVAENVTGMTFRFGAKQRATDVAYIIDRTGTIVDAPAGLIRVQLTGAETANLAPQTLEWELELTDATGTETLDSGTLRVLQDVVR